MSSSSSNLKLSYLHWLRKRKINRPTITLFSLSMSLSNIALDKSAHEKSLSYWNIFWLKLTKWRIIPYQVEDKAFTPLGLETFASITQSDTIYPGTLKMMLLETIRNDDFQINKALQYWLLRHCFEQLQHRSKITTLCCTKNCRCESSLVTAQGRIQGFFQEGVHSSLALLQHQ